MPVQNLRPLLEALCATPGRSNASGEITTAEALFGKEALERLDAQFAGVYVFVVYDAAVDTHVASYLASGSLATDSGTSVLALFERAPRPSAAGAGSALSIPGIEIQQANPIVDFCRAMFRDKPLQLPGLVVVERLATASEAAFVPIQEATREATASKLRKTLSMVGHCAQARDSGSFGLDIGVAFAKEGVSYTRSGGLSAREHVIRFLRLLWDQKKDIAAAVPVIGKVTSALVRDDKKP